MNSKPSLSEIRKELTKFGKFEVVAYGSYASGTGTLRSDIDLAVVSRERDPGKNLKIWQKLLSQARPLYHVNVFELLPLHIKAGIIGNHMVVFGDKLELSEYFYHFRKLWADARPRYEENQFSGFREKLGKLKAGRNASV